MVKIFDLPQVVISNGQAVTSSLAIARYFAKSHPSILQLIDALPIATDFRAAHFQQSCYLNETGAKQAFYQITFEGFLVIINELTDKNTEKQKTAYQQAFQKCASQLRQSMDKY